MKDIKADSSLVAYCGLYCGACRPYLKGNCKGCHQNDNATWCQIRQCCIKNNYLSCHQCATFDDPKNCGKFHNLISRFFGFIFRSDRAACIAQIKKIGIAGHAEIMAKEKKQSIRP
ncbi:MAG: DUF3795 domain-containing protein [Candidatus Riflebacteria bacterium]